MDGILPWVCVFTQPFTVASVAGALPKSTGWTSASNALFVALRKLALTAKPWRYQIEFAMPSWVEASSDSRSTMRPWYPALMPSLPIAPNPSVVRIASKVEPAAPFIVIPSASDALSGETKMFAPGVASPS